MFSCQDISCIYIILFRKIKVKNITVSSLWNVHTLFLSIGSWQFTDSRLCVSATVRRLGRSRDLLYPPSTKFRGYIGITLSVYESPEGTWGFSKTAISKSLYRIVQSVLSDCNSFPRIGQSVIRGNDLQSERTSCPSRGNELLIRGNELLIRENGLHNSI